MSYPPGQTYTSYTTTVPSGGGQSYSYSTQGYPTSGMQRQVTSQGYAGMNPASQAAALQQQQRYMMAGQGYYPTTATAQAYPTPSALQQQQQQQQQQQLQQLQQLQQQQYARQAQAYQAYPAQAYTAANTSQAAYQPTSSYQTSQSYPTAQTTISPLPQNATGYTTVWTNAPASTDKQYSKSPWASYQQAASNWPSRCASPVATDSSRQNYYYGSSYPSGGYVQGYGTQGGTTAGNYQLQVCPQPYPPAGTYQVQSRYPSGH